MAFISAFYEAVVVYPFWEDHRDSILMKESIKKMVVKIILVITMMVIFASIFSNLLFFCLKYGNLFAFKAVCMSCTDTYLR